MDANTFCLDDYDCIGFDLDCTLADYNTRELSKLAYNLMVKFLTEKKSYPKDFFAEPFEAIEYFLQKGLFMDLKKGNVLNIGQNGTILKASHGTKLCSEDYIVEQYGPKKTLEPFEKFVNDPVSIINTPYEKLVRASLDCFDLCCVGLFAKIVDRLDERNNGAPLPEYNIWTDILEGLYHLYSRNHYSTGEGDFFSTLKQNPERYYTKWDSNKIEWLKEVKKNKFVFMLTGSFLDFASLTASTCIGENWEDYFDVILCYARKPFFFAMDRPFYLVEEGIEKRTVKASEMQIGAVYSQGNWKDLKSFLVRHTKIPEPKCMYVGDNLIQDVYSPVRFECCDTVAVVAEIKGDPKPFWGSYFKTEDGRTTYWNYLVKSKAKVCISDLSVFSKRPLDFKYSVVKPDGTNDVVESNGYYAS